MSYLLDTHVLLWSRLDAAKLSNAQKAALKDSDKQKFISTISIWEMSLKFSLGKLDLGGHTPEEFLESAVQLGFQVISPGPEQLASFHRLPVIKDHKDPFDRMLIWQAMQNDLTLLSHDGSFSAYKPHGLNLI